MTDDQRRVPDVVARTRPLYTRPSYLALLVLGGAVGTSLRSWLEDRYATVAGGWPWVTFAINVVGSLVLGALLTSLARTGPDAGWRRRVRVGLGTGTIGGFTTYSTFVVEVDLLLRDGRVVTGVAYALVSVVIGVGAAVLGVLGARAVTGRRAS